jgi:hypothetical protein
MTSLRTFQAEIDTIHDREMARQRAQILADREKEKEMKKAPAQASEDGNGHAITSSLDSAGRGMQEIEDEAIVRWVAGAVHFGSVTYIHLISRSFYCLTIRQTLRPPETY